MRREPNSFTYVAHKALPQSMGRNMPLPPSQLSPRAPRAGEQVTVRGDALGENIVLPGVNKPGGTYIWYLYLTSSGRRYSLRHSAH